MGANGGKRVGGSDASAGAGRPNRSGGDAIGSSKRDVYAVDETGEAPVPEGFTLSLALVDALPVLLFCAAAIALGCKLNSALFLVGAFLAFLGGAGKVAWKLVIALAGRNIPWLGRQMRFTMPLGFLIMLLAMVVQGPAAAAVLVGFTRTPALVFVLLWFACMCAMGYMAKHNDQADARSNWIEQLTNAFGQAMLLIAVLVG